MTLNRRDLMVFGSTAAFAGAIGLSPAIAAEGDVYPADKIMQPKGLEDRFEGAEGAPVTVIEYASPTCPHCASWHVNVYPEFKAQYIDQGKVRFALRPFIRNVLDAAVFMLAEAAGNDEAYYQVIDTFFKTQSQWAVAENPKDAMLGIAQQLGFTQESFEAALTNQELFEGMNAMREQALDEFDLTGTPTFYIDGKQMSGDKTLEELAAEIDPKLS